MAKKNLSSKDLMFIYDPEHQDEYAYDSRHTHASDYPYNKFPKGKNGKVYKETRFREWEPFPEDIVIRYRKDQVFVDFKSLFPHLDIPEELQVFQLRSSKAGSKKYVCESINFFASLYDYDNVLLTNMFIAKCETDSNDAGYTLGETYNEYCDYILDTLFPEPSISNPHDPYNVINKIKLMVEENDVGDDIVGLFPTDFIRDIHIVSFMVKVMMLFVEHFIRKNLGNPSVLYEHLAKAYIKCMNRINPNIYNELYNYFNGHLYSHMESNVTLYDKQIANNEIPQTTSYVLRKTFICDSLAKVSFANEWDDINKRPKNSCVGFIKSIVMNAKRNSTKIKLRYNSSGAEDISQLLSDDIAIGSPVSVKRSFNPGEFCCMSKDLNIIIATIVRNLNFDDEMINYYIDNLPQMNQLSSMLVDIILYNKFHSSILMSTLNLKQKYILLLYLRSIIMDIYSLSEEDTIGDPVINIIMGKTMNTATKILTKKDLNIVKKYVALTELKQYMLSEKNVNIFCENILRCVFSSYTIVNHNDPSLLNTELVYDSSTMAYSLLDMIVKLFESM